MRRGDESFVNEPHVGGGNPVVSSKGMTYFNDVLGTTVGVREGRGASRLKSKRRYTAAALTAFGEPVPVAVTSHNSNIRQFDHSIISSPFFTGKPQVEGLGRVFLCRNYRADLAKWQTADPLGYPDGWNQLAYCGNGVTERFDYGGAAWEWYDFCLYYYQPWKPRSIDTDDIGYTQAIWDVINNVVIRRLTSQIDDAIRGIVRGASSSNGHDWYYYNTDNAYSFVQVHWVLAGGRVSTSSCVEFSWHEFSDEETHTRYRDYHWRSQTTVCYIDDFSDPLSFGEAISREFEFEVGSPYVYSHIWENVILTGGGTVYLE